MKATLKCLTLLAHSDNDYYGLIRLVSGLITTLRAVSGEIGNWFVDTEQSILVKQSPDS